VGIIAQKLIRLIAIKLATRLLKCRPKQPPSPGQTTPPVRINTKETADLLRATARGLAGLPAGKNEVVWVDGDRELAVDVANLEVQITDGVIRVAMPVRCDQTGAANIEVVFAVGRKNEPSGLYASTYRLPNGPDLIVRAWGESLVAFAWQCVLGMAGGVAGAVGRDDQGSTLVPVELTASKGALEIVPMARHRFSGSGQ